MLGTKEELERGANQIKSNLLAANQSIQDRADRNNTTG